MTNISWITYWLLTTNLTAVHREESPFGWHDTAFRVSVSSNLYGRLTYRPTQARHELLLDTVPVTNWTTTIRGFGHPTTNITSDTTLGELSGAVTLVLKRERIIR